MIKVIAAAATLCAGTVLLLAQTGSTPRAQAPSTVKPAVPAAATQARSGSGRAVTDRADSSAADVKTYRAFVNQYCVSCHNSKTAQPEFDPVNLEKASLDDVLASAATWERVLRKLSVRAMPPQGMQAPAGSRVRWLHELAGELARSGVGGARRVARALCRAPVEPDGVRQCGARPARARRRCRFAAAEDDADFGFDNIATYLKTSPLLLERYVTAAQRISILAVGDPKELPGTTEYSISREFSQNAYIEGLPLGTRGGTVVRHIFPADGEYKLAARLFRGIEEGYVGVEGNDTPHTFVITIDGEEVFSTTIGGPKDHEEQA